MPKAKKMKSGSWRCQVFDHIEYVDGKKKIISKSITVADPSPRGKRECERLAAVYAADKTAAVRCDLTVKQAIRKYIDAKKNVLSPNTLRGYESLYEHAYGMIGAIGITALSQEDVQRWMSKYATDHTPKTCRNAHGLLYASLTMFMPRFILRTQMPQPDPPQLYTPSDADIKKLLAEVKGTELEKAIMLAAFGTLRLGEILALTSDDIDGNTIRVTKSVALDEKRNRRIKQPKNTSSIRIVEYPPEVISLFDGVKGPLVAMTGTAISKAIHRAQKKAGIPQFRFHDLRAYSASIMHATGIPDVYIMERGGWKTDATLKKVYRRAIEPEAKKYTDQINGHFAKLLETGI